MIRLVASDIDGTLLLGGAKSIDPEIFRQIARLREKGILFCPASGRQYDSLRRLFAPAADELAYLCENGAVLFGPGSPGPLLGKTAMDRDRALELCRDIVDHPECEVLISGVNTSYLCPKNRDIVDHIRYFVGNNICLLSRPEEVPEDLVKVSAYCRLGTEGPRQALVPKWGAVFRAAVAGEKGLDVTLADKGTGLRQLCAALGVAPEEVMAFGDNYNDLPMLELAGHPYLMESAALPLRRRGFALCRRVEDVLKQL